MPMQTSEKSLVHIVLSALEKSPYFVRRRPHVEEKSGHVVIRGTVPTFFLKQMAQETLRRIDGVEQIENQLQVLVD
jgi:osmotically-inducible protein OsmY